MGRLALMWTLSFDVIGNRARLIAAELAFGALGLLGALDTAHALRGARARLAVRVVDETSLREAAWAPVRPLLAGVRAAGYATDVPNSSLKRVGFADQTRRYFQTQYFLAPTQIDVANVDARVVADFETERAMTKYAVEHGYEIRWHSGGRALLERRQ